MELISNQRAHITAIIRSWPRRTTTTARVTRKPTLRMPASRISSSYREGASSLVTAAIVAVSLGYLYICGVTFSAYRNAQSGTVERLSAAVRLDPRNAEYWQRLGLLQLYGQNDPHAAISDFQRALQLNSRSADSWIGLAFSYQLLGELNGERHAIAQALQAEPKRPEIAWQAANLYAVLDDRKLMLNELCVVRQHDPTRANAAFDLAYRATKSKAFDCAAQGRQN